jgi:hypothetical protein
VLFAFSIYANPPTFKTDMADEACSKPIVEKVPHAAVENEYEILLPDGFDLIAGHRTSFLRPEIVGLKPIELNLSRLAPIAWFDVRQCDFNANKYYKAISLTARQLGLGTWKCPVPVGWC